MEILDFNVGTDGILTVVVRDGDGKLSAAVAGREIRGVHFDIRGETAAKKPMTPVVETLCVSSRGAHEYR